MTTLNKLRIKMDGQEHEINKFEMDPESNSIFLDLEDTISVQIEDVKALFTKDVKIMRVGHDDEYIKAKIDSFYVESESTENQILGISF